MIASAPDRFKILCKRPLMMMSVDRILRFALLIGATASTLAGPAVAENWPHWRGPRRDGISEETGLPEKWSKTENVRWKLQLPGAAGATPVVWENNIFLTSASGDDLVLWCVDAKTGQKHWEQSMATGNKVVRNGEGNSASPSPSTDGKHVWAMMSTGDIGCFDFDGKAVWKFNLQDRYGKFDIQFGMASTPLLDGDRLYLQLLYTGGAHVIALDKSTGKEVWHQNRKSSAEAECEHSYASPYLYRDAEREYLLTHGADFVVAHQLTDGSEIWRCGGINPKEKYNFTLRLVASPVAAPGLIVVPSAKSGPVLGLKADLKGDVTNDPAARHWTMPRDTPDVPSPLIHEGLVYLCRENGVLICLDAKTGELQYQERTQNYRHRGSPVYGDGKIYLTSADGVISIVKVGRKFNMIAQNDLKEPIAASPVVSNGVIYFRTYDSLIAIQSPVRTAAK